ncbi:MAG: YfiR family protein [Pseudomonadota bacterium]|nr:YfiR family protein [Pseudomonadota bacterium]
MVAVSGLHDRVVRRVSVVLLLVLFIASAGAQPLGASIDEVKAAYIHKFAGYIDWPPRTFADPTSPIVVGVVGANAVFDELTRIAVGRPVQGRPVQVRRLSSTGEAAAVHVLFIGQDVWRDAPAWLAAIKGRPVALITDAPHGAEFGAVLTFVQSNNRLRFEASLPAAEQAGVRLSSRLLAVAERVVGASP